MTMWEVLISEIITNYVSKTKEEKYIYSKSCKMCQDKQWLEKQFNV